MDDATRMRLVGLFFAEAKETMEGLLPLADALANAEGPAEREAAEEFGRLAHGLKGAASSVGIAELAEALHGLEEIALSPARDGEERRTREAGLGAVMRAFEATVAQMEAASTAVVPQDALGTLQRAIELALEASRGAAEEPPAAVAAPTQVAPTPVAPVQTVAPTPVATVAAPAPAAKPSEARAPRAAAETLTVASSEVDHALSLAAQIARGAAAVQELFGETSGAKRSELQDLVLRAERLEGILVGLRLVEAEDALAGISEEVAQLCERLGKRARLDSRGGDVRADRSTLGTVKTLLRHLVRNALDHGLESPAERRANGKREEGTLTLTLSTSEARLHVRLSDDGRGFDLQAIRRRLSATQDVSALSDGDVLQLFASEGGSTRETASEISGRGLGLSAVARLTRASGGEFQLFSEAGRGSAVEFSLPLEVYATEVLSLQAGRAHLALPTSALERTLFLGAAGASVQRAPTGDTLAIDERIIPLYRLCDALGLPSGSAEPRFALVVRADAREAAFAVDEVGTSMRVVPRKVKPTIDDGRLITAVAPLPQGDLLQIVNPRLLLQRARSSRALPPEAPSTPSAKAGAEVKPARRKLSVLLAEDSRATREVLRVLLEEQGFTVRVAENGAEAWQRLSEELPDVVVSDVNMPQKDGLSLTRLIHGTAKSAKIPVVLLTSQDDPKVEAAGRAAGASAYLIKSKFNAALLDETLDALGVFR